MVLTSEAFSGFSVNDLTAVKAFYEQKLSLEVEETPMGLWLKLDNDRRVCMYSKLDHASATHTILNFPVADIDQAVDELKRKGITFETTRV